MSLIKPGVDTHHIINQFRNSKSLATLSSEEDRYQAIRHGYPMQTEAGPKKLHLYTKSDLADFKALIQGKSTDEVLELLGIKVFYNENGSKKLSHYGWPKNAAYSFASAGIDETKLLDGVTEIKGSCNLIGSSLKDLGNVSKIGGSLTLPLFTSAEDLSSVQSIGRNVICDVENPQDAIDLIKKVKLNPKYFGGYIDTGAFDPTCMGYGFHFSQNMAEAINKLQARNSY